MATIRITPLKDELSFGTRITGVNWDDLESDDVHNQIKRAFEDRGLIVFQDVEASDKMMLALSNIIGPLQDLTLNTVSRVDSDTMPGVVKFTNKPSDANIFEINGKSLSGWTDWHFDACYTGVINRGGVLRVVDNPPEGGNTGFADGIQLYNALSPELRAKFTDLKILYQTKLMYQKQRFGLPKHFRMVSIQDELVRLFEEVDKAPRSVHPAVWTRRSGERVLHVAPYQAAGIQAHEDPEGDALLESLIEEIHAKMTPYWHEWKLTDMVAWDNWRFIHTAGGHDPSYSRTVHRTTITGDYGLGALEGSARQSASR